MQNASNLSPLLRALILIVLLAVPLGLVILQRLPQIREILSRPNSPAGQARDGIAAFEFGGRNDVDICPKCFRQNARDHKFCGYCGTEIKYPEEEL